MNIVKIFQLLPSSLSETQGDMYGQHKKKKVILELSPQWSIV